MSEIKENSFLLTKPVLFLLFNRPDLTFKSFQKIRKVKPPRLYVSVDGPREDNESDLKKISEVKKILTNIDWNCDLKTLYQKKNLGSYLNY